jgi:dipeptidyl aminopeptidase/acylaminoacyl peptidase
MDLVTRALLLLLIGAVGLALVGLGGFLITIHPFRYTSPSTPMSLGWAYQDVSLQTEDGVRLAAWLVPGTDGEAGRSAVIVLHGYPFSKAHVLGLASFLHEDYDLLFLDLRYFGESGGAVTTLGLREWRDLVAAADFLRSRGYTSIGVWGFSLGGSVALLALPHEPRIDAVVADSAYSDLREMTHDYYGRLPLLAGMLVGITDLLTRAAFGAGLAEVSPARAAASVPTPLLLIHGGRDRTIPLNHHERIRRSVSAHTEVQTWIVDEADHGETYALATQAYEGRVRAFFARHLR